MYDTNFNERLKEEAREKEIQEVVDDLLGSTAEIEKKIKKILEDRDNRLEKKDEEIKALKIAIERIKRQARETEEELTRRFSQDIQRFQEVLAEAKEKIERLEAKIEALTSPPQTYASFVRDNGDGTVDVKVRGEVFRVLIDPVLEVDSSTLKPGQRLIVSIQTYTILGIPQEYENQGTEVSIDDLSLENDLVRVATMNDQKQVVRLASNISKDTLRIGEKVLLDKFGFIVAKLPKNEVEELILEAVPDVTYEQVGGLSHQIEEIRDALELPSVYPELFRKYQYDSPKGILLYGPPGCGKTLLAKAIANAVAKSVKEKTGKDVRGYFLNVKGPELLTKWVGETERKIREVFQQAREKAKEGHLVVVFFDEMDAIFRTRGTGISSDIEHTAVTQLTVELDGVEPLSGVIVVGATNRQDLIDPGILRPGRLDKKIRIGRPDEKAACDIFKVYLIPDLPLHPKYFVDEYIPVNDKGEPRKSKKGKVLKFVMKKDPRNVVDYLISRAVERMYDKDDPRNRFIEITYQSGETEILYFKDFISGAIIENIVKRAKKKALKVEIEKGDKDSGIELKHLFESIEEEFTENEDLPNTANPQEWARIIGRKGEQVVNIKSLLTERSLGAASKRAGDLGRPTTAA